MSDQAFDYEARLWGLDRIEPGERSIAGFRLEEALHHLPARGRLIEVGCGGGRFLRALAELRPGLALVGCDVSRAALARLAEGAPGIETRLAGPGAALPAEDAEFDAALALDLLEHLERPDAMLAELRRILAPGGVLHLHVPCEGDARSPWRWLPGESRDWKRRFGGHLQRFRRKELLARIEQAGFTLLRVRYSLHALGALADVAAFAALARESRRGGEPRTTGDLLQSRGVRLADALLWAEAKLLSRIPSWALHVSARKAV